VREPKNQPKDEIQLNLGTYPIGYEGVTFESLNLKYTTIT